MQPAKTSLSRCQIFWTIRKTFGQIKSSSFFFFLSMVNIKPRHLFDSLTSLSLLRNLRYEQEEDWATLVGFTKLKTTTAIFGLQLLHRFLSQSKALQSGWSNKISQLTNICTWKGVKLKIIDGQNKLAQTVSSVSWGGRANISSMKTDRS